MNQNEARDATIEAARAAELLAAHVERLSNRLRESFPLNASTIAAWEDDPRERLHALLRMYEQLYDLTSRKLFRGFLTLSNEPLEGVSARNQVRRLEALGAIADASRWFEIGTTRNALVHDYPLDPAAQAERANRAWKELPDLIRTTRGVINAMRAEELIP
ncbi:hypothetical protein ACFSCW_15265 [Sphingomonas tabacisoli]|uniref:Nucleotidyltransferase n=1 Tax=Sphingomonas tabacisoli TaxID=2249466 RepID=A0ABW4I699_9SPHN